MAVSSARWFETPLGRVPVDEGGVAQALTLPEVAALDAAHAREHSLEVHLPFLQAVLGSFSMVPLVVGETTPEAVARLLEALWNGPDTLVVVSSDLSHYLPYDEARMVDAATAEAIETLKGDALDHASACGRLPIAGLLAVARRRGLRVERLDLRNSGDTAGPRDAVVGYGAWGIYEQEGHAVDDDEAAEAARRQLLAPHSAALLKAARLSIRHGLQFGFPMPVVAANHPPPLSEWGAAFVTLRLDGELRGCIGSPTAWRPLIEDVAENAHRAAFRDPRFPPLEEEEFERMTLSVSVLTEPVALTADDRAALLRRLRPGRDGLIVEDCNQRALFLPSVWDHLPEAEDFLSQLLVKAGFSPHHWSATLTAHRFSNIEFKAR